MTEKEFTEAIGKILGIKPKIHMIRIDMSFTDTSIMRVMVYLEPTPKQREQLRSLLKTNEPTQATVFKAVWVLAFLVSRRRPE